MATSPLNAPIDEFNKGYDALVKGAVAEALARAKTQPAGDLPRLIREAFASRDLDQRAQDLMLDGLLKSMGAGLVTASVGRGDALGMKRWLLEKAYAADGTRLSVAITDLANVGQVTASVRQSMELGESWKAAAQRLHDVGVINGDVAGDVQTVLAKARKMAAAAGDPQLYADYKKGLRGTLSRVEKLVDPGASKLRRAYMDVLELTDKSSTKAVEKAAKMAAYFKARSNAERVAATEMAKAYGDAVFSNASYDGDVVAVKSVRSSAHDHYDICDFWAEADMYGLGEGIFPKDHAPPYPYHPYCTCILDMVYEGEVEFGKKLPDTRGLGGRSGEYTPSQGVKYLEALPAEKQKALLGVAGKKAFEEAPHDWPTQVNNFKSPVAKGAQVPVTLPKVKKVRLVKVNPGAMSPVASPGVEKAPRTLAEFRAAAKKKLQVAAKVEAVQGVPKVGPIKKDGSSFVLVKSEVRNAVFGTSGKTIEKVTQNSVEGIKKVHYLPAMNDVKVSIEKLRTGVFGSYSPMMHRIELTSKKIFSADPTATFYHEYGHALDLKDFVNLRKKYGALGGSLAENLFKNKEYPLTKSIFSSLNKVLLQNVRHSGTLMGKKLSKYLAEHVAYLDSDIETFARAYAQYVASKQNAEAYNTFLISRQNSVTNMADPQRFAQWTKSDFEPIARAFDELFREEGLLK